MSNISTTHNHQNTMTTLTSSNSTSRSRVFRWTALLAQVLILLGGVFAASAQTITLPWHEPFPYPNVGANLGADANNGNVAWGNANKSSQKIAAGSLSYPAFALSSSNKVSVTVANSGPINDFNEARPQFANVGPSHGSMAYLSFLMNIRDFANISATSPGNAIMGFTAGGGTSRYGSINLWSDGGNIKVGAVKYNGATVVSSSTFFASTVTSNTTYLVVLKYQYDTNSTTDDLVTVWLNPASSSFGINGSEDAGNNVVTGVGATDGTSGLQRCYLLDGFNVDVDEVRIGTSWQAVMPAACDAPLFFASPQSATNVVGGITYLTSSAGGTANVYQWRRSGTNLINGGNISGANGPALSINPVGLADAANYDLVASNACSGQSVTSSVATLTVISGANLVWSGDGVLNEWDQTTTNWNGNTATFAPFDSVTFDDTSANTFVTLVGQQNPGFVTVNSTTDYTFGGSAIGGIATLIKTNTGNLNLTVNNTHTGKTIIRGGGVNINSEDYLGANPPIYTGDQLTIDGGTLRSGASLNINDVNRGISLGAGGATFEPGFGAPLTLTTFVSGSGQLRQNGPALLKLDKANTYTGGTVVNGGRLEANQLNSLGTGDATIESGATLFMSFGENGHTNNIIAKNGSTLEYRSGGSSTYALVLRGALTSPPGSSFTIYQNNASSEAKLRLYGAFTNTANITLTSAGGPLQLTPYNGSLGEQIFSGDISGVGEVYGRGTIVLSGQNTFNRADATYSVRMAGNSCRIGIGADSTPTSGPVTSSPLGAGSLSIATHGSDSGTGTLLAWGGARTVANPIYYTYATNTVTLVLGGSNALTLSGPIELARATDTQGTNRTLDVVNNAATTLSGVISDNGLPSGIVKTGSGSLYLDGANTYTGTTAINAGLLAGIGSVVGPVTVGSSATIGGGTATAIGTLTVNNDLTVSGNVAAKLNRAGFVSDLLSVSGALTNAGTGTVTVTNLGAALQIGDTFTLFNKALTNGSAMTITGGGMVWSNRLALDGKIEAVAVFPTTPTNLTASVSGSTLTLSWPANYLGWSVQSNAVSVVSPGDWFTVPGSASTTTLNITIDPAKPNVFYRMSLP